MRFYPVFTNLFYLLETSMCNHEVGANGWNAVPVDAAAIFVSKPFIN
jgi:hypothetical protein